HLSPCPFLPPCFLWLNSFSAIIYKLFPKINLVIFETITLFAIISEEGFCQELPHTKQQGAGIVS
ncbi:MAG: hypothetical protein KAQ71_18555, partial [Desulfobulbaceae bacterium]|nr:hypothetical protein [Desulfobulbaceae bacterium]